jgi:hypothetical protein
MVAVLPFAVVVLAEVSTVAELSLCIKPNELVVASTKLNLSALKRSDQSDSEPGVNSSWTRGKDDAASRTPSACSSDDSRSGSASGSWAASIDTEWKIGTGGASNAGVGSSASSGEAKDLGDGGLSRRRVRES